MGRLTEAMAKVDPDYISRVKRSVRVGVKDAARRQAKEGSLLPVTITFESVMRILERQHFRCAVTGLRFRWGEVPRGPGRRSPSIDRIKPNGAYAPNNVRVVAYFVNVMRGRGTDAEMEKLAEIIVERARARRIA